MRNDVKICNVELIVLSLSTAWSTSSHTGDRYGLRGKVRAVQFDRTPSSVNLYSVAVEMTGCRVYKLIPAAAEMTT